MSITPTPAQITLGTYARLFVRHWKAVVAGVLIGLIAATAMFLTAPKAYTSRTSVLVRPTVSDGAQLAGGRTSSVLNLDTEAQILRSSLVATRAAAIMGTAEDPLDLVRQVKVTVPPNTSVLDVNFTAATPAEARRGTTAFAQAYLENRAAAAQAAVDADISEIEENTASLDTRLADIGAQLALMPAGSAERVYLEGERQLVLQSKGRLLEQRDALIGGAVTGGEVLTQPRLPRAPSAPNERLYGVGGLLAGLCLGLGIALISERRNRRIHDAAEIVELYRLPVLAELELVETPDGRLEIAGGSHVEMSHLSSTVRTAAGSGRSATSVLGASPTDVNGWIAANLALTLALAGDRVALVSATPEPASATKALDIAPALGLAEVLTATLAVDEVLVPVVGAPALTVLGAPSVLGAEWLNADVMHDLVDDLARRNSFIVLDSTSVTVSGDAQAMASHATSAVVVVLLGATTPHELESAARAVAAVGTPVLGVVAVRRRNAKSGSWLRRRRTVAARDAAAERPAERPAGREVAKEPTVAARSVEAVDGTTRTASAVEAGSRRGSSPGVRAIPDHELSPFRRRRAAKATGAVGR